MAASKTKEPGIIRRGYDPRDEPSKSSEDRTGWLSIEDGEFADVVLLYNKEDIIRYEQIGIWTKGGAKPPTWPYSGDDDPMHELELDPKQAKRYRAVLPVVLLESDGTLGETKIWGMSKRVHTQLLDLADEIGPLKGSGIRIRRTGKDLSTNYTLTPKGKRKDVSDIKEPDVLGALGPLTPEAAREMLAKRFGKETYEEFLDAYRGRSGKAKPKASDDDEKPAKGEKSDDDDALDLDDLELK